MKRVSLFFVGLLAFLVPALMAPTSGGFPSSPTFQRVGIGIAPAAGNRVLGLSAAGSGAYIGITASAAAANNKNVFLQSASGNPELGICDDAWSTCKDVLVTSRSGATVSTVTIGNATDNPAITLNGTSISPASGTFVASFDDACTTTPTVTFTYVKLGTLVTLTPTNTSGFACTGDSLAFATTGAPVPAALRPATATVTSPTLHDGVNNGAQTSFTISITTSGNVSLSTVSSAGQSGTYTAAGSRTFGMLNVGFSYLTNN